MIYLYLGKIQDDYFLMNSSKEYDYAIPSSHYGLVSMLDQSYEDLTVGIHGKVANQVIDLNTLSIGCKKLKKHELNYHLNKKFDDYLSGFNTFEVNTWEIQRLEAQKYLESSGSYTSGVLNNIAQAKNIEVKALVDSIIEKSGLHQARLLEFKLCKDRITTRLELLDTLEQLEAFDVVEELNKQLSITSNSDEKLAIPQEDLKPLSSIPSDELLKLAALDSTNLIERTEDTENNEFILEPPPLDNSKEAQITEYESLEQEVAEGIKTKKKKQNKYTQINSKPTRQN